jgi:8-oxo-dGTP pyrophosphatase MutT (NUDIX family)
MTETTSVRRRTVARVLLLDDSDRVLLFEGIDPWVPEVRFWFTPGGGAEGDESLEQAAARELQEETGLTGVALGPVVWTRRSRFTFEGEQLDQRESFFLARVPRWEVDTSGFDALEQRAVLGHRWWTLAELASTAETLFPSGLSDALTDLLRDGPPAEPVELAG